MSWFWVSIILYVLGAAQVFAAEDHFRQQYAEEANEFERDDDFARVSGVLRTRWAYVLIFVIAVVFWPVAAVLAIGDVVFHRDDH